MATRDWASGAGCRRPRPLTFDGASVWYLYNTEFALLDWGLEKGAVGKVDAGTYLLLHGAPDTTITLTVKP